MKNILWASVFVLLAGAASAQTADTGFVPQSADENQARGAAALPFQVPVASPAVERGVGQPAQPAMPAQGGGLFPELKSANPQSPVTSNSGLIHLIIDNVTIVNPPMDGVPFCSGSLTVENQTSVTISNLDLSLRYGSLDVPVSFGGIAGLGGTQTQGVAWAGSNCASMLSVPTIQVVSCVAGPMSKEECQNKIKYMPIK